MFHKWSQESNSQQIISHFDISSNNDLQTRKVISWSFLSSEVHSFSGTCSIYHETVSSFLVSINTRWRSLEQLDNRNHYRMSRSRSEQGSSNHNHMTKHVFSWVKCLSDASLPCPVSQCSQRGTIGNWASTTLASQNDQCINDLFTKWPWYDTYTHTL